MNVKGRARGGPEALADHLENAEENETIRLIGIHGVVAGDLRGALLEMDALGTMLRTDRTLYHGSINPEPGKDRVMTADEWAYAEAAFIKKMGFENQPYVVMEHEKIGKDGVLRLHRHIVTALTDLDHMRAIRTDHNYRKHEEVARDLERYLGHDRVQGAHAERFGVERPERAPTQVDYQQAKHSRIDPKEAKALGAQLWQTTDSGKAITAALDAHGWILARGDKQRADGGTYFMAIDPRGDAHELRRMVPVKAAELYARMADIDAAGLPGVTEAKTRQRAREIRHEAHRDYQTLDPAKLREQGNTPADGREHGAQTPRSGDGQKDSSKRTTQENIRAAFGAGTSPEQLNEALAAGHISLARVSADEARASSEHSKLYREQKREHEQWTAKGAFSRFAALTPEPPRPRYAPVVKEGEIVAVDGRSQVYRLDKRTTGLERGAIKKRLAGIDAVSLRNITDTKAAMHEARRATLETARAQRRIDAPLGKTAGEIRMAWTLSRSQKELHAALADRGMTIAQATAEEAYQSERTAAFAREAGNRSTVFKAGELVAVNGYGSVYRFDEHTTGQFRGEIDKRLAGIDARNLMSVADAKTAMIETRRARDAEAWRDEQDKARPATAIEQKIIECRDQARDTGATVRQNRAGEIVSGAGALADRLRPENERQTHSATIHGPQAFAARLEQAGIAIVRVTAGDVKALDQLRGEEELARAETKDVQPRKARIFAKVKVGDLAAVTRQGNVFRLNPHRVDAGLESAISSSSSSSSKRTGLPGVTETRTRFASERENTDKVWQQHRAGIAARQAQRETAATRQSTMRGAASATIKAGETVNRSTTRAGKGAGILGRGIIGALAGLLKLFDIAPAKPPSPEQQKRNFYAAQEQQASDDIQARKDATDEQRRQHRKTQEQDSRTAQILGTPPAAHDRQRPREHERDR